MMSFYDLTKDFVLSAKELFKYSGKRKSTLPTKGGPKDFEPDESWMQSKALETFHQQRTAVLSEPRVEKLKSLVKASWDGEQRLINVEKPGKFWAHMGFTDKRRNWLYPEEALFLMECNTLEVYHCGVPLSFQEAYNMFLGFDVSIEEYQVFSHLRRLGFVVLRHENQPIITPYEKQINLDKYIDKKTCKERASKLKKNKKDKQLNGKNNSNHSLGKTSDLSKELDKSVIHNTDTAENSKDLNTIENHSTTNCSQNCNESVGKCLDESDDTITDADKCLRETGETITDTVKASHGTTLDNCEFNVCGSVTEESKQRKRPLSPDDPSSQEPSKRSCLENQCSTSSSAEYNVTNDTDIHRTADKISSSLQSFYEQSWESCFIAKARLQSQASQKTIKSNDSSTENGGNITENETSQKKLCIKTHLLPNIAGTEMVVFDPPSPHLLPENVDIKENLELLSFDVGQYHIMNPQRELNKAAKWEENRQNLIEGLEFSLSEWMPRQPKVSASNWKEYKLKLSERMSDMTKTSPVDHLWKGKVTPLISPGQSWSHQSILDKLSIIKSADNETLLTDSDCVVDVKITYDVHLPDSKFKKSMPGIPNHRVCVSKCLSDLPGLAEIHQVWSRFKDNVPLHWSVVDSGEIAFYVFDSSHISKVFK